MVQRLLSLTEYQTQARVPLDDAELSALQQLIPSIDIRPAGAGLFDLSPNSTIGAFSSGDLTVSIGPKLPIDRVLFLMSYALDPEAWTREPFRFDQASDLHEAVIPAFVHHLAFALRRGLLQGYRTEEEALQTLRGRVRVEDQIRLRYGVVPPVEVRYDEFTEDIEANRLLRAAINRLGRLPIRSSSLRASLRGFDAALASVSLVEYRPGRVPTIFWTRLNSHYRSAVTLARLVLEADMIESHPGRLPGVGFSVDMNRVFEDFIVVALREALRLSEASFPKGDSRLRLDTARRVHLRPDLSWWSGPRCTFVGDVKYKRVLAQGILHPDLYQLLAYTTAARLPAGLLVYAAGESESATHEVVNVGKRLEVVTLDLAGKPQQILSQIEALAERVRALRQEGEVAAA